MVRFVMYLINFLNTDLYAVKHEHRSTLHFMVGKITVNIINVNNYSRSEVKRTRKYGYNHLQMEIVC